MTEELSTAEKMKMDQIYAKSFFDLLAVVGHDFVRKYPMASHAVMGACLKYSATLARQIGMRANDFRGLATAVFNDPPGGPRL